MNTVEYDYNNVSTPAENAIYSELIADAVQTGEKLSDLQVMVTVQYNPLSLSETYRCSLHTASRVIARNRKYCHVSWRVTLNPEAAANRMAQKRRMPKTIADVIHGSTW